MIEKLKCKRCGWEWIPRTDKVPTECPACKSRHWTQEKQPKEKTDGAYVMLRNAASDLALVINELCPDSREKSLAVTSLQQTIMWANASIALRE